MTTTHMIPFDLGQLIWSYRDATGESRQTIAERTGCSVSWLRKLEHGWLEKPDSAMLARVVGALGVPRAEVDRLTAQLRDDYPGTRIYFRTATAIAAPASEPHHPILERLRGLAPRRPLSHAEALKLADRQALALIRYFELTEPTVDENLLCELPFVTVIEQSGLGTSGMSTKTDLGWLVVLKGDEPEVRKRFSLGHELKHVIDDPLVHTLYPARPGYDTAGRIEQICDRFAAALLMPAPWLRRDWLAGTRDVQKLARRYGVSSRAMEIRLQTIGLARPQPRCSNWVSAQQFSKALANTSTNTQ